MVVPEQLLVACFRHKCLDGVPPGIEQRQLLHAHLLVECGRIPKLQVVAYRLLIVLLSAFPISREAESAELLCEMQVRDALIGIFEYLGRDLPVELVFSVYYAKNPF